MTLASQEDGAPHGICIIGRTDFATGMGSMTYAACELLSRHFDVALLPTRPVENSNGPVVQLPNGRLVPLTRTTDGFAAYLYLDVVWNGAYDFNFEKVPARGFRVVQIPYDSDELPSEWVDILNTRFDLALFTSAHLEGVAIDSGVRIGTGVLPIGLDLEPLLTARFRSPTSGRIRFGTLSAFHDRKGLDVLIEAFIELYADSPHTDLVIHSNLAIGNTYDKVMAMVDASGATNIVVSHGLLDVDAKNNLLDTFDVYVNCSRGEGYSIGPREALALGKPVVITDLGAHADLHGVPGVFHFGAVGRMPARYPEIDNRVFGAQTYIDGASVRAGLEAARAYATSASSIDHVAARRARAADFSMTRLSPHYRAVFDPDSVVAAAEPRAYPLSESAIASARRAGGRHGRSLSTGAKVVVPAHDGGFFSLFNTFMSHLVWGLREDNVALVLPDWDAAGVIERAGGRPVTSFCYSQPDEGNLWLKLFEPLFDLTAQEMNDRAALLAGSTPPARHFNEDREPLLTYVHAFELYQKQWFHRFRRQYHQVLATHVRLRPELRAELDALLADHRSGKFVISAHVKHPSHGIEQPEGRMAGRDTYVAAVREELAHRGIRESSEDWRIFVATDQDRVVALFDAEFGDRVIRLDDVTRIPAQVDAAYDQLADADKLAEGHQLQHQMAAEPRSWSWRLAWEVWRDAELMANSDVLLHAVSNVATAVSYLGPDVHMRYVEPD